MMTEAQKKTMEFLKDSRAFWMRQYEQQHGEVKKYRVRLREAATEIMSLENQLARARAEISVLKETIESMELDLRVESSRHTD